MQRTTNLKLEQPGQLSLRSGTAARTCDVLVLILAGIIAAALIAFMQTPLRIPGHVILKAALPIAGGLAFTRFSWAGTLAGASAISSCALFLMAGVGHIPAAAFVSLSAIGPALDLARRFTPRASLPYWIGFAMAGLLTNLAAFAARFVAAWGQSGTWHPFYMQQLGGWALASFAICGITAGIVGGAACYTSSRPAQK